uniref:Pogo transposable element derived with ZNF domain a n=1 Tax=Oryzias latipes TaxID=8090 RepID=A0A3P9KPB7_ORYLA
MMDCDEQKFDALDDTPETVVAKQKPQLHEVVRTFVNLMEIKKESDSSQVEITPVPIPPLSNCKLMKVSSTEKPAGSSLGFTVNGRPVNTPSGGAELKLCSHPGGSTSGFTSIQIPVTLTVHSPAGTHFFNATGSLSSSVNSSRLSPPPSPGEHDPSPKSDPIPIITGVVSGEAAQKVLNDHNVNFTSDSPSQRAPFPSGGTSPPKSSLPQCTPPAVPKQKGHNSKPAANKLLRKGEIEPATPPKCKACGAQYKLVTELRGFMCLCSPSIALSLRNMKRRSINQKRRNRSKNQTQKNNKDPQSSNKGFSIWAGPPAAKDAAPPPKIQRTSDNLVNEDFSSLTFPSVSSSSQDQDLPKPTTEISEAKMVILLEDFYYGKDPGRSGSQADLTGGRSSGPFTCIICSQSLLNNIKLMHHMQQHVTMMSKDEEEVDPVPSCSHCFRNFPSSSKLQCHLEAVHIYSKSVAVCRICELAFEDEPAFMRHMKTTHKPGEMPYICQVCDFRSSFYSDVWSHFQDTHANTKHLLCQFCLRVLRSNICYQQHFARHQRKHKLSCDKCRLHFLYVKERVEHNALCHKTHIKPPQLCGLKPGTKVTVRMYAMVGGPKSQNGVLKSITPCKVVNVSSPPPIQEAPKKNAVEGLRLSGLKTDRASQSCIECLASVPDFQRHFPSVVRCSLCRFVTCCSASYANHMINNHTTSRRARQFPVIFQPDPRLSEEVICVACSFSTFRGDVIANHLNENPSHGFARILSKVSDQSEEEAKKCSSDRPTVTLSGEGKFVPIHLVPSKEPSKQLTIKPLNSNSKPSFTPAMTVKIMASQPDLEKVVTSPDLEKPQTSTLSIYNLSVILSSMCHGVAQASRRFQTRPGVIRSWITRQQRGLLKRKWRWKTDKMAEWVLNRREQQLTVGEDVLLLTARATLGGSCKLEEYYNWTVDVMLRHDLGVQTTNNHKLHQIELSSHFFLKTLFSQVQNLAVPLHCLGCMDELPVFINFDQFSNQNPLAFQLFTSHQEKPVIDIVLCGLSDGSFLPPMLFYTGAALHVPEGFPDNVVLESRQQGFTEEERLALWVQKVWCPNVASKYKQASILLMDVHRGHLSTEFQGNLSSCQTQTAVIPAGCCCRLQPLDVCVAQVLRDHLMARWNQLVSEGGLDGLGLEQLALMLACWVSEASFTLNSKKKILHKSFSLTCSLDHSEAPGEAARMITALTEALNQPPEGEKAEPKVTPSQVKEEKTDQREKEAPEMRENEEEEELCIRSPSHLRQVFDGDSDEESFPGFPDC